MLVTWSFWWKRWAVYDPEGAAGGKVHDSDGPVAPSVGSGCSRAVAYVPFLLSTVLAEESHLLSDYIDIIIK